MSLAEQIGRDVRSVFLNENDFARPVQWDGRDVNFAMLSHLDVVPAGEGWTSDPYTLTVDDTALRGRGVTDDKGPAIAALYAMAIARELYPDLPHGVRLWLGTA